MAERLLLAGLGNPGPRYAGNRHNIGFMAIDAVARRHGISDFLNRFQGELAGGRIGSHDLLILKPMTFMNESGRSVAEVARFYKILSRDIVVFYDELDLAAGKLRVKRGGGAAGHNGIRSIDRCLGSTGYRRVRLGIGHPGEKHRVTGHVLSNFNDADDAWLAPLLGAVAEHVVLLLDGDDGQFMNKVALAVKPPQSAQPPEKSQSSQDAD